LLLLLLPLPVTRKQASVHACTAPAELSSTGTQGSMPMPLGERCLWPGAHCSAAAQPLSALRSPGSGRVVGKSKSHTTLARTIVPPHTQHNPPACLSLGLGLWPPHSPKPLHMQRLLHHIRADQTEPGGAMGYGWPAQAQHVSFFFLLRILFLCGQAITFFMDRKKTQVAICDHGRI
jgi:hypothetical protein